MNDPDLKPRTPWHAGGVPNRIGTQLIVTSDCICVAALDRRQQEVDERTVQKKSLMPQGQHKTMSPVEFADPIAYLRSL